MRWRVQLGINQVRVMFAKFAKIGRAARANPVWQNLQTSRVLLIPNCTSNIA